MSLMDPRSWAPIGFGDETALIDFAGSHGLWHDELDGHIRRVTNPGARISALSLGDGPMGTAADEAWHQIHQRRHDDEAAALGLLKGPDLTAYDLARPDQFATFMYLHAQECARLQEEAGL